MLGSSADAEDALRETLLAAWRGLARFEHRSSLRSWLHAIAHNTSVRMLQQRPRRGLATESGTPHDPRVPHDVPLAESSFIEPIADDQVLVADETADPEHRYAERESIEVAFIAALQHLPARQRATLILRDVLAFSARETADILDGTPAAIDSVLQRARKTVEDRLPDRNQAETRGGAASARTRSRSSRLAARPSPTSRSSSTRVRSPASGCPSASDAHGESASSRFSTLARSDQSCRTTAIRAPRGRRGRGMNWPNRTHG